jgi:hypothetical protein
MRLTGRVGVADIEEDEFAEEGGVVVVKAG